MLVEEDATDIAARSAAERGTGIYHAILPPDMGLDYDSAREKLKKFLDKHCPRRVGAASGTLPAEYEWESDSYITDAHLLVPGSLVTFNNTNPSTGGNLSILIQSISASAISVADPLGFGEGHFRIRVRGYVHNEIPGYYNLFKNFSDPGNYQGVSSSGAVVGGGGSGERPYVHDVSVTTNGQSISSPGTPLEGSQLVVILTQDGTGGHTVTWAADYQTYPAEIGILPNEKTVVQFIGKSDSKWYQISEVFIR